MAKYEDFLIEDYKELLLKKDELVKKLDAAALNLFRLKMIDGHLKSQNWILIKSLFMIKKIKQLVRCERKAKLRFKKLAEEFWPINKRLIDIRTTLFKYYDNQIEECVRDLGMKEIENLEDLLILYNGHYTETTGEEE